LATHTVTIKVLESERPASSQDEYSFASLPQRFLEAFQMIDEFIKKIKQLSFFAPVNVMT